ncbi:hypothetical protein FACS189437_00070 [Bacteroidia bacterium]|nr:hypothetical protein FACS189437_00070 [Bacteroidia bacterium]
MSNKTLEKERIAKNTFLLYVRMFFQLLIGLYTSRAILNILGIEDYGIYNVVGGVVGLFLFINSSMSSSSSRFITFALGKGNKEHLQSVFSTSFLVHIIIAVLFLILAETIGLWLVCQKLVIPDGRMMAALWVYQFSVITCILNILNVPYNATIIAHERMRAFAGISTLDVVLKLFAVLALQWVTYDRLIYYSAFLFAIALFDWCLYRFYSIKHFEETSVKLKIQWNKFIFVEMCKFSGWSLLGYMSYAGIGQGINILLNIFFGPAVNAARGIAMQVQNYVNSFCLNFQMALNPQITKSYAQNDLNYMHSLIITSSKFSFYLLFFISFPLILETPLILHWWLGNVPEYTVIFVRLVLLLILVNIFANPIYIAMQATGHLKKYQLTEAIILLLIFPSSYFLLKFGNKPPYIVFIVQIIMEVVVTIVRLSIVLPMIRFPFVNYIKSIIIPVAVSVVIGAIIPICICCLLEESLHTFFIVCMASIICVGLSIYITGITKTERVFLKNRVSSVYNRIKHS